MKNYNNYLEQVNNSVKSKVLFNNYLNVVIEELPLGDMQPATVEALEDGDIYQWYVVDIYDYENEETEKLGIFWDDTLELYILPVTHFGMLWEGVSPVDERKA